MAGIYIHIPFCKQACTYCNFHFSTNLLLQNDVTAALLKEIELRTGYLENEPIDTIYFGGGTPSILPDSSLGVLLSAIKNNFQINPKPEITLEANPDDMSPARLMAWQKSGFNRLSIGVQSFFSDDLRWMNRAHTAGQSVQAIADAKAAGFTNFSLDLIYGLPRLSDENWSENLSIAISLQPTHISCYALTVEPKTVLYKLIEAKKTADIDPERQAAQFFTGIQSLETAGFEHYEISSFAKPGMRSRHNSSYWQSKKYLGLGPAAHSFDGQSRQWNIANNALYIRSLMAGQLNFELENLAPRDVLNEYIMTSLRTMEGLDLQLIEEKFGNDKRNSLHFNAREYMSAEKMERREDRLVLTKKGKLFADGIASALFFE